MENLSCPLFPCLTVLPLWVSTERGVFKAVRPDPSLQPMNPHISHTYQADKQGCLSIIDRIAVRQPVLKSRKCLRWQEARGPQRASFCMHSPVARAASCLPLVCFMGITQPRKNSRKRFIQPQGYSKEGSPNLRLQRFLMTTRNISIERQRKLNWQFLLLLDSSSSQCPCFSSMTQALGRAALHLSCE